VTQLDGIERKHRAFSEAWTNHRCGCEKRVNSDNPQAAHSSPNEPLLSETSKLHTKTNPNAKARAAPNANASVENGREHVGTVTWPPYDTTSRATMVLDTTDGGGCRVLTKLHDVACDWWDSHMDITPTF
jgi:hypothetical protein